MKKLIALLLACVMLFGVLAACGNSAKPGTSPGTSSEPPAGGYTQTYEWNVACTFGQPASRHYEEMLNQVTELTNGRIKFNFYPSNSLVSIPEVPNALKDGVADIALVAAVNYPSIFAYNAEILGMPFVGLQNGQQATDLWYDMYEAFPNELGGEWEKAGARVWYLYSGAPYHILTINPSDVIRTPADLAGHKIMSGKLQMLELINDNGGAGIQAAPTAYYENLEKGVADGVVQSFTTTRSFGALELVQAGAEFGTAGIFYDLFFIAISEKSWDKLDPEIQAAFEKVNADRIGVKDENDRSYADNDTAISQLKDTYNGTVLTDAEYDVWAKAIEPYNQAALDRLVKDYGRDKAPEIYEWMLKWIAEHNK